MAAGQTIRPLGLLPTGRANFETIPRAVNFDGTVVVGDSLAVSVPHYRAFRWVNEEGVGSMQDPLLEIAEPIATHGEGVSENGDIVVGTVSGAANGTCYRWTKGGVAEVFFPFGATEAANITGCSGDGSVLVGETVVAGSSRGFVWSTAGGAVVLGDVYNAGCKVRSISKDGHVAVGFAIKPILPVGPFGPFATTQAVTWTDGGGPQTLGPVRSEAYQISADGTVAVGFACDIQVQNGVPSCTGGTTRSARWVNGVEQPILPPPNVGVNLTCISADGRVAAGSGSQPNVSGIRPFMWRADIGLVDLNVYLPTIGINLTGWQLKVVTAISSDGMVLVGQGTSISPNYGPISQGFIIDLHKDSDGDGLYDDWETDGIPYLSASGLMRRYPLPGANPLRKDLYVEIDAMAGCQPAQSTIDRVVAVFDQAPVAAVPGLAGGVPGIALHVDRDDAFIFPRPYVLEIGWEEFQGDKAAWFGTGTERASGEWSQMKVAKAKAYRYGIFARKLPGDALGRAEIELPASGPRVGGNDFMIGLGTYTPPASVSLEDVQAAAFMHELGHTLGLYHGGNDPFQNFNPNHYSVMNYMWAGVRSYAPEGRRLLLDYNRYSLPTLQESVLDETAGIGGFPGVQIPISVRRQGQPSLCGAAFDPLSIFGHCDVIIDNYKCLLWSSFWGPVDWNNDGVISPPSHLVCADPNGSQIAHETLGAGNEWDLIAYNFRNSAYYSDLARAPEPAPCPTHAMEHFWSSLPPPPPPVQCPVAPPIAGAPSPALATYCTAATTPFRIMPTATGPMTLRWRWRDAAAGATWMDLADGPMPGGTFVDGAGDLHLRLTQASAADFGTDLVQLSCRVKDACGQFSDSSESLLLLGGPSVQTPQPTAIAACPDGSATLAITATGQTGPYQFQWHYFGDDVLGNDVLADGVMPHGTVVQGVNESSLNLSHIHPADFDDGVLRVVCAVTDGCAVEYSELFELSGTGVLVLEQPERVDRPCTGGPAAVFSVAAVGAANLAYQWRQDGVALVEGGRIQGSATPTLTISSPVGSDAGGYTCLISCACGQETSGEVWLDIGPPQIVSGPEPGQMCLNGFKVMYVEVHGSAPFTFQWMRNGVELADNGHFTGTHEPFLLIHNFENVDVGMYSVRVQNDCGNVVSSQAALSLYPAAGIGMQPVSRTVCPTGTAVLSVAPQADGPFTSFRWQRENAGSPGQWINLFDGPWLSAPGITCWNTSGAFTRELTISLTGQCPGPQRFRCIVAGVCDSATSGAATVTTCRADFDCSGASGVSDIFAFLAAWFSGDSRADFNGVGGIGVQDIFDFLAAWFSGC